MGSDLMELKSFLPPWLGGSAKAETKSFKAGDLNEMITAATSGFGGAVTSESAMRLATVFACVRVLAFTMSYLPWRVYKLLETGGKELAFDHPLHFTLNVQPNEFQTPANFKVYQMMVALNHGDFCAFKVRDGNGNIRELLPIKGGSVTVKRSNDWQVTFEVQGEDGRKRVYGPDDIYHFYLLSSNGFSGASVLSYARETIGQGRALQEYGTALFRNGARPDYAIELPGGVSGAALKNLKEDWLDLYRGTSNAGRPAFLEEGMKLQTMNLNNDDIQFLETRQFTRSEICGFYGVPPHMIGDLSKATFSNIEHQSLNFLQFGMMPWINQVEESARIQLLKPEEVVRHKIDVDESMLRRGDLEAQTKTTQAEVGKPIKTVNERREELGMNRSDDPEADKLALQAGIGDGTGNKKKTNNHEGDDDEMD